MAAVVRCINACSSLVPTVTCLVLCSGAGSVGEGDPPGGPSDVTLSLSVRDMHDILSGKVSAFNAYMSGNVEVTGDLRTALRLADIVGYIRV